MSAAPRVLTLEPQVLLWARERSSLSEPELARRMKVRIEQVLHWEGTGVISPAHVDKLAHVTHTPVGFLYLPFPPRDRLPITDFRSPRGQSPRPSPDLLETIQSMQRRVAWMREELIDEGAEPLEFVGSRSADESPQTVALAMRSRIGLGARWAAAAGTWDKALRDLREYVEDIGVIVVINGVVGNNTHRKLDVDEFRGFSLVDEFTPLVFINGADFKVAQMFTLAHELVHIFLGSGGVSEIEPTLPAANRIEQFCNSVAAEFLVPAGEFEPFWNNLPASVDRIQASARLFKVSTVVAARRALELGLIDHEAFVDYYNQITSTLHRPRGGGGDFWNTQNVRVGRRFGTAVVRAVADGRLLYRDAYSLTGLKGVTFDQFAAMLADPS